MATLILTPAQTCPECPFTFDHVHRGNRIIPFHQFEDESQLNVTATMLSRKLFPTDKEKQKEAMLIIVDELRQAGYE